MAEMQTGNTPDDQSASTNEALPKCFSESSMIPVYVGEPKRKFLIHRDILCSQSAYFNACLNNPLTIESQTNEIILGDEHDVDAFPGIVTWLYGGKAGLCKFVNKPIGDLNANRRSQVALTAIYVQADKLNLPQMKNDIVDLIIDFSQITLPSLKALDTLQRALPIPSQLEQYYLDCLVYWLYHCPYYLQSNVNGWHVEANEYLQMNSSSSYLALKQLCLLKGLNTPPQNPNLLPGCKYHEHGPGAPYCG